MQDPVDFVSRELKNAVAVGAVSADRARLWLRAEPPGELEVTVLRDGGARAGGGGPAGREVVARGRVVVPAEGGADGTLALTLPDGLAGGAGALQPLTAYRVEVARAGGGEPLGAARFETAPRGPDDAPASFCFGALSCHQPFDDDGRLLPESLRMLRATRRALRERGCKFVLLMGDQIYSDHPPRFSLFDDDFFRRVAPPGRRSILECSAAEVRALYQQKHRVFWGCEEIRKLQAEFPCYPMMDDHEIVDNFGSDPRHGLPEWRALRAGALAAFYDYQGSRVLAAPPEPPPPEGDFHYAFSYGPCSLFVMDLRSSKLTTERATRVYAPAQFAALERFLAASAGQKVVFLVATVPLIYTDSWLVDAAVAVVGEGTDAADRWNHAKSLDQRDLLLALLHAHHQRHPRQRLVLLGGDIHVGCAFRVEWEGGGPPLLQFTSSAVSNRQGLLAKRVAELLPRAAFGVDVQGGLRGRVDLVEGVEGASRNPYGGLNAGIVHVDASGPEASVEFELIGIDDEGDSDEPRTVYRTGPV
ncbi:MAG TPA: alkaline phosphatase D family protein [Polyangiaceae bacterium]|nr:alkaline phosphatase D family protein [Polyangiaceae bacterium]